MYHNQWNVLIKWISLLLIALITAAEEFGLLQNGFVIYFLCQLFLFKVRRFGCKVQGDKGLARCQTQAEGDKGLARYTTQSEGDKGLVRYTTQAEGDKGLVRYPTQKFLSQVKYGLKLETKQILPFPSINYSYSRFQDI